MFPCIKDVDECQNDNTLCTLGPLHGTCIDLPGTYECGCSSGFEKIPKFNTYICNSEYLWKYNLRLVGNYIVCCLGLIN